MGYAEGVIEHLMGLKMNILVDRNLFKGLQESAVKEQLKEFSTLDSSTNYLICIGGDGSMLQAVTVVKDSNVPILGINTGRLGFLTSLQKESLNKGLQLLWEKKYRLVKRTLCCRFRQRTRTTWDFSYALNEISVNEKIPLRSPVLTRIRANNLLADGLIVTTPTGSTGYSLSSIDSLFCQK